MNSSDTYDQAAEAQLLRRLLARDKAAVREFYDQYLPLLLRFIRRKVDSEPDVEEIAQDVLFAFLEGARDFTGKCKLATYLCSIAKNKIIDYYRRRKIKKVVFSQLPNGFESLISQALNPEEALDQTLLTEKIGRVFSHLSPQYAKMLTLKYIEGRSVEEIAKLLSCSFKSAESILFRARKAFVKQYTNGS